jgi:hypothetical protein
MVAINVSRSVNPLVWAFVAFVGALCVAVPLTLLRGRAGKGGEPADVALISGAKIAEPALDASVIQRNSMVVGAGPADGLSEARQAQVQEWIEKIARLDEEWEAGSIEPNEYRTRRAAWKKTVVEIMWADGNRPSQN